MHYGSLRQVEAFRCVMVTGSMTLGARMMGVTQPAISRLLKDLQATLQIALFERRGSGVIPTAEATRLYAEVERSFVGLERVLKAAEDIRTKRAGSLRIAAMSALANGILSRFCGGFLREFPDLDLEIVNLTSPMVIERVAAGQVDLGFAFHPIANPGLGRIPMPTQSQVAVLPVDHPLAVKKALEPADFGGQDFISLAQGAADRRKTDRIFEAHGVKRRMRVETPGSAVICSLVTSGFGVGICDPFTASEFQPRGLIVRPFRPRIPFNFSAYHQPTASLAPVAWEFLRRFRDHVAKQPS